MKTRTKYDCAFKERAVQLSEGRKNISKRESVSYRLIFTIISLFLRINRRLRK